MRNASTPTEASPSALSAATVVDLDVIPNWGGAGYDAFVIPAYVSGTAPTHATNSTGPGPNDNNVTVPAGVLVRFVISNLDNAVNLNFTEHASTSFTIYNDTTGGYVALRYSEGQLVSRLPVGHTFTIPSLGVDIPLPPDTMVTFTYTFSAPGAYEYVCMAPCGSGMGLMSYMDRYVIVTSP